MESNGGGAPRRLLARSATTTASRPGAGAFVYDGMRPAPLFSSTNFARSLRKAASFAGDSKKHSGGDEGAKAPPRRALSSKENNVYGNGAVDAAAALPSPGRRSLHEPGAAASRGSPWEPARRPRRSPAGSSSSPPEEVGSTRGSAVLRDMMTRKKEEPEKEEAAHRARMLTARLLQWRFANARMEKAMARATSAAENKLFYTWLRVAELRNIQAAKRIVAQRRRQKLKLARLLRPQLPLLASWDPLAKPHSDAVADLAGVLAAACTAVPLADGAQGGVESLHDAMFACVGTVNEIEANADTFFTTE
ncbi:QWRF motif-containing protein 7-like isoform X2 [Oryza brachyantha]|uniref:QWRF motif-containing protein 7-like isoform X2 n=1 Tax=Oryza brachyantha TaxID=4533 RepID=UPI001ADC9787|nr:QWRF motif-containing protein 7-like isoform X2 [Oryza brachyantha]